MKKRKASTSSNSPAPKKMRPLTSSIDNPIDAVPVSFMPSKDLVPFGEDYVIPSESDEENPSTASSEQMDEEIEVDEIPSTPPRLCLSLLLKRPALKKWKMKM